MIDNIASPLGVDLKLLHLTDPDDDQQREQAQADLPNTCVHSKHVLVRISKACINPEAPLGIHCYYGYLWE